ncbi:MAG: exodeoxyribonuclease VII small subunit [Chloroflexi bacterium RBG_16_52_11]|nr:MAG: exodeoxyribonuclease VII small subunit [Chloroflexi bacterium RBG_16_52_11]
MTDIPVEKLTFEQAYKELENIVLALETGQHSLETAMQYYERGQALARHCASLLDRAELKIQRLSGEELEDYTPAR